MSKGNLMALRYSGMHTRLGRKLMIVPIASALVVGAILAVPALPAAPVTAQSQIAVTDAAVAAAAHLRTVFGLPSDFDYVRDLMKSPENLVAGHPGLILKPDEAQEIDLDGRSVFSVALNRDVIPYLESLPTLGGYWIDQARGGQLTDALTDLDADVEAQVESIMPIPSRGVSFVTADHSMDELRQAENSVADTWERLTGLQAPVSVGIRPPENALLLGIEPSDMDAATRYRTQVEEALGVSVVLRLESTGTDTTCDRNNCTISFRSGFLIRRGSMSSNQICTAAWLITNSSWTLPFQAVSAGHCLRVSDGSGGYVWGSGDWYNSNNDLGPTKDESLYSYGETHQNSATSIDVQRVGLIDGTANMSTGVFNAGSSQVLENAIQPTYGAEYCASLGYSDYSNSDTTGGIHCGIVDMVAAYWYSERGPWRVNGTSMDMEDNYNPIGGDSGSPVYAITNFFSNFIYPVGVQDHERITGTSTQCVNGWTNNCYADLYFANVYDALAGWPGSSIWGAAQ